jgi:hypothetical protein
VEKRAETGRSAWRKCGDSSLRSRMTSGGTRWCVVCAAPSALGWILGNAYLGLRPRLVWVAPLALCEEPPSSIPVGESLLAVFVVGGVQGAVIGFQLRFECGDVFAGLRAVLDASRESKGGRLRYRRVQGWMNQRRETEYREMIIKFAQAYGEKRDRAA